MFYSNEEGVDKKGHAQEWKLHRKPFFFFTERVSKLEGKFQYLAFVIWVQRKSVLFCIFNANLTEND